MTLLQSYIDVNTVRDPGIKDRIWSSMYVSGILHSISMFYVGSTFSWFLVCEFLSPSVARE